MSNYAIMRFQKYKNIEILLINDGSKDKSLDVCKSLESKDKRIVLIDKKNKTKPYIRFKIKENM